MFTMSIIFLIVFKSTLSLSIYINSKYNVIVTVPILVIMMIIIMIIITIITIIIMIIMTIETKTTITSNKL